METALPHLEQMGIDLALANKRMKDNLQDLINQ